MTNCEMFAAAAISPLLFEQQAWARGHSTVAGIDEAGRGPLAGPVVAAAAVLPQDFWLEGLDDSKKLSPAKREQLYPRIRQQALTAVGVASVAEIDRLNILQATLLAMQRALYRLPRDPDHLLIDGTIPLPLALSQQTLKKGDSRSLSIAAASVIAKVVRDRIMHSFDRHYPGYGFAQHKGYGTRQHRRSIQSLGPSPQHRRTFAGVREWLEYKSD
jgi:ribonuclease HII